MKKRIIVLSILIITLIISVTIIPDISNVNTGLKQGNLNEHDFDPILPTVDDESYISYSEFRSTVAHANATSDEILTKVNTKNLKIRFDTAEELWRFSIDVSYHQDVYDNIENVKLNNDIITTLLSLHYVLGNDIDYSVMKSRQFIPIGYSFNSLDGTLHRQVFTGIFDGRGFEISNLYFAGYDLLVTTEGNDEESVDIALSPYYSMFTYNEGTIQNLGLINPTYELQDEHEEITRASNLVGLNTSLGIVDYVYVIDSRENILSAGIRMKAPTGTSKTRYTASGIIYENQGSFTNAYFTSNVVVNGSYINNFRVQPVLYLNSGDINNLVYDLDQYLLTVSIGGINFNVTTPNDFAIGEGTNVLKTNSSLGSNWYYYPNDRYPSLLGLDYLNGKYQINNAVDLITFSKIINYNSTKNDTTYHGADYLITNNIEMKQVSSNAYVTPIVEFTGTLSGETFDNKNYYISNLTIENGINVDGNYYSGLFSSLRGSVSNITFYNASININNTDVYYSSNFKIGLVAGILNQGIINNISINHTINLGSNAIGQTSVGSVVGQASGELLNIYTEGNINTGIDHNFNITQQINPSYNIGGVVGSTGENKLVAYNILNTTNINGIGSLTDITTNSSSVEISIGGILGRVNNTSSYQHNLGFLTNRGKITANDFNSNINVNQYLGGIVGLSQGFKYKLTDNFGDWRNEGIIDGNIATDNNIISSGIVVSNHIENVEFIFLYNYSSFVQTNNNNFSYASLVYDLGTTGVTLSQSTNFSDHIINDNYSGVFYSKNNAPSLLRFVENKGNINFNNSIINKEVSIAGISLSENINYLNVYFSGNINVTGISGDYPLWISGISKTLSSNYYLKNTLNEGKIIVANINLSKNIYIGGLVNINDSGDLQLQDNNNQPKATIGIINSINYANINSTYDIDNYGIKGTGNTFVGGITTLNRGSIQDSANLGDLEIANVNNNISINSIIFNTTEEAAGLVKDFIGGVTVGGIAASTANGNSRIYDCTNSGEVIAISKNFSRAGGILAVSLYGEITAGKVPTSLLQNNIENSILSNCINFGDISAVTESIATYSTNQVSSSATFYINGGSVTQSYSTTTGTNERPGIYSSAGGVIGYGLSVMRRMVSHGEVSSTDIAGGIVGATYAIGPGTTVVNIDTAINYGSVRAVNNAYYSTIDKIYLSVENISNYYYDPNDPFIFPVTNNDIRIYPESKRGIGGIFGRLQRGRDGYMTSENGNFDFIVNMDPNVDLIGRLDQVYNYTSSSRFFIFIDCIYYSARVNDTTQAVFTGYYYYYGSRNSEPIQYTTTKDIAKIERYRYEQRDGFWYQIKQNYIERRVDISISGLKNTVVGNNWTSASTETIISSTLESSASRWVDVDSGVLIDSAPTETYSDSRRMEIPTEQIISRTSVTLARSTYYFYNTPVPIVTENPGSLDGEFIYDENFIMRDDSVLLSNGEPITSYIYYVENGVLSDRFKTSRPYGMYVLSTSSGSSFGSALPSNMNLVNIYRINGILLNVDDYNNIDVNYRISLDEVISNEYLSLLQSRYNDKSAILESNQEIILDEITSSNTKLINPSIDFVNKTITFELSLETIDINQTILSYRITKIILPSQSIIATRIEDYNNGEYLNNPDGFRNLLYQEKDNTISDNLAPDLTIDISPYLNITSTTYNVHLGYFTSYSEAAVNNTLFILNDNYTTDYEVLVNIKPHISEESPTASSVVIDGITYSYTNYMSNPYQYLLSTTIRVNFTDPQHVLIPNTDILEYISLYYGAEEVSREYYNLSTELVDANGNFSLTIILDSRMRSGDYNIKYKYYYLAEQEVLPFKKEISQSTKIEYLEHYSYNEFVPTTNSYFSTYINFGYDLGLDYISWNEIIDETKPSYLNNKSYIVSFLDEIVLSPFASITNIVYNNITYNNGYRTYEIEYVITAEDGVTKSTHTHYIVERELSYTNIYKNNNTVSIDNIFTSREALSTSFAIDFGIDRFYAAMLYNLYDDNPESYFNISVRGEDHYGFAYSSNDIVGITYSADRYLNINIDQQTLPGNYYFTFTYNRGNEIINIGSELEITKNLGKAAYLLDIKFSESAQDTAYGKIYVSNENGIPIISSYAPRIYYAGIDYDNADKTGVDNFRIDGTVANTPLNEYLPYFLNYLPSGSTISRKAYNSQYPNGYWTSEVDNNSTDDLKAMLATDFTLIPETGLEPGEDEDVIITYRVTSEDGSSVVYYHITVVDIIFNVSLIFDIYYEDENGIISANDSPELRGKTILINVNNFNTDVPIGSSSAPNVSDFLSFTQITNYNNSTNMFYVPYNDNYLYRFGRNLSGFYSFKVDLPFDDMKYEYTYLIKYNNEVLNDVSNYVEGEDGKYFYIQSGTKNRTRRFQIYISKTNQNTDDSWGLNDSHDSWK